jgi:hypothetical protein
MKIFSKEYWKPIIGYEGLYEVSNLGRIKSVKRYGTLGGIIIPWNNSKKAPYLRVGLSKNNKRKRLLVHRLVAEAFIPNPNNLKEVNHINGNKQDNKVDNLEWNSKSQNHKHAFKLGLRNNKGTFHPCNRLTIEECEKIKCLVEDGNFRQKDIVKLFNISLDTLYKIKYNKHWSSYE